MTTTRKVAVIIGSLRKDSLNRKLAQAIMTMGSPALTWELTDIGALPLFNQDHESDPSAAVRDFKMRVERVDAVLFVTPEYNRSVPGVLKNALDVGSRPSGKNSWNAKPSAVISVSPGAIGGLGANHHLRQSLVALNMPTMCQPEAYVGSAKGLFDDKGALVNDATRRFLQTFVDAFVTWIDRNISN